MQDQVKYLNKAILRFGLLCFISLGIGIFCGIESSISSHQVNAYWGLIAIFFIGMGIILLVLLGWNINTRSKTIAAKNEEMKRRSIDPMVRTRVFGMIRTHGKVNLITASDTLGIKAKFLKGLLYAMLGEGLIEGEFIDENNFKITSSIEQFVTSLNQEFEAWGTTQYFVNTANFTSQNLDNSMKIASQHLDNKIKHQILGMLKVHKEINLEEACEITGLNIGDLRANINSLIKETSITGKYRGINAFQIISKNESFAKTLDKEFGDWNNKEKTKDGKMDELDEELMSLDKHFSDRPNKEKEKDGKVE